MDDMSDNENTAIDVADEPIFEASVIVKVLGEAPDADSFKTEIMTMELGDIHSAIFEGDMIGTHTVQVVEEIPANQVAARLDDYGNDGEFFDGMDSFYEKEVTRADPAGRALRAQMEQGWSNETMEALAREFIGNIDMSDAFAAFLEARAQEENEMSSDMDGGPM
jgi:hypothetical protein